MVIVFLQFHVGFCTRLNLTRFFILCLVALLMPIAHKFWMQTVKFTRDIASKIILCSTGVLTIIASKVGRSAKILTLPAFLYSLACLLISEYATVSSRIIAINIIIVRIRVLGVRSIRTKLVTIFSSNPSLCSTI